MCWSVVEVFYGLTINSASWEVSLLSTIWKTQKSVSEKKNSRLFFKEFGQKKYTAFTNKNLQCLCCPFKKSFIEETEFTKKKSPKTWCLIFFFFLKIMALVKMWALFTKTVNLWARFIGENNYTVETRSEWKNFERSDLFGIKIRSDRLIIDSSTDRWIQQ